MWRISKLEAAGFRGFAEAESFDLERPCTLLFGENGTGKSSALNAIEWAIFGKDCVGSKTGIRERLRWEVPNRHGDGAVNVGLELIDGTDAVLVKRSRQAASTKESLDVKLNDGRVLEGSAAEEWLAREIPGSFRDFLTTTYQHQEVVRAVLVDEARETDDALDRLLGLSAYRNILSGLKNAKLDKMFKDVSERKDKLADKVKARVDVYGEELADLRPAAESQGVEPNEMSDNGALARAQALRDRTLQLYVVSGLAEPGLEMPDSIAGLDAFSTEVQQLAKNLLIKAPETTDQQKLLERRSTISRFLQSVDDLERRRKNAESKLSELKIAHGSESELSDALDKEENALAELDSMQRSRNEKAKLVQEAISYLESAGDKLGGSCPLCHNPAPNLLGKLRTEWADQMEAEIAEIRAQVGEAKERQEDLEAALSQWRDAENEVSEVDRELSILRSSIANGVGVAVEEDAAIDDVRALLASELDALGGRIRDLESTLEERRERANELETACLPIGTILEILRMTQKVSLLNNVYDSEEFRRMDGALDELARLVAVADSVRRAVADTSNADAESKIRAANNNIGSFFKEMTEHPAFGDVELRVDPDGKTGQNRYSFVDSKGDSLLKVLSQGDLNCLALSIFLGLSTAASEKSPFGFLLLDDPSQSLGSDEKGALAKLIAKTSETRQVIVATMDSEFRKCVSDAISGRDLGTYSFDDWTPEKGPVVKAA